MARNVVLAVGIAIATRKIVGVLLSLKTRLPGSRIVVPVVGAAIVI